MDYRIRVISNGYEPVTVMEFREQVKDEVASEAEDRNLELYIQAEREWSETFCRRTWMETQYSLSLDHFPWDEIILPNPPVQTVDSVGYYDENNEFQEVDPSVYELSVSGEDCVLHLAPNQTWPNSYFKRDAVVVLYTAGYGTGDDSSNVPARVKQAIRLRVGAHFDTREDSQNIANRTSENLLYGLRYWGTNK